MGKKKKEKKCCSKYQREEEKNPSLGRRQKLNLKCFRYFQWRIILRCPLDQIIHSSENVDTMELLKHLHQKVQQAFASVTVFFLKPFLLLGPEEWRSSCIPDQWMRMQELLLTGMA
ncbi:uncharacterized protein LOC113325037 [Papaver somniferum]|uniref:uncharacterized protein LOC113325037 n=1 Tax=Papaver somniferum TaxID=3469 RepID=UPI000E7056CE|nr:uncharacterized protein LOC113325037 [Papaver somniferum]XP_026429067.1 uncharacterized protein LOC113325037 [Papaver somniferum]XP_026429071.1 uncharacterized protein LOC113325037 [Papaver somniferum]